MSIPMGNRHGHCMGTFVLRCDSQLTMLGMRRREECLSWRRPSLRFDAEATVGISIQVTAKAFFALGESSQRPRAICGEKHGRFGSRGGTFDELRVLFQGL